MGSSHLVPGGVGVCWQEAENDDEGPDELSADVVDKPSTFYQHKRMVVQVLKREIIEKSSLVDYFLQVFGYFSSSTVPYLGKTIHVLRGDIG